MSDEVQTISHLREVIKNLQLKLVSRTSMLVDILPHVLESVNSGEDVDSYVCHEWFERHSVDVKIFKEEYERETVAGTSRSNNLPSE